MRGTAWGIGRRGPAAGAFMLVAGGLALGAGASFERGTVERPASRAPGTGATGSAGRGAPAAPGVEVRRAAGRPHREGYDVPATLGAAFGPARSESPVYPRQELPLRFHHGLHVGKLGLACRTCHDRAYGSTTVTDDLLPSATVCDRCHGSVHPPPAGAASGPPCATCHAGARGRALAAVVQVPPAMLHFDHRAHLARGARCTECHGDMTRVGLATELQLPREATCLRCHDGMAASNACATCHPTRSDGRLVVAARDDRSVPRLVPRGKSPWGMAHDLRFVRDHAATAKVSPEACANCHDDRFCVDCHAGPTRPMRIHAPAYLTLHAQDAAAKTADCAACHRRQTFCLGCHERLGFGNRASGPFGVGGSGRVHPEAGWTGPPGAPQGHAFAAQRSLGTCVSCHTEDACLSCHATSGAAVPGLDASPHGPNFAGSSRCTALERSSRPTCLRCHAPGDPNLACR